MAQPPVASSGSRCRCIYVELMEMWHQQLTVGTQQSGRPVAPRHEQERFHLVQYHSVPLSALLALSQLIKWENIQ